MDDMMARKRALMSIGSAAKKRRLPPKGVAVTIAMGSPDMEEAGRRRSAAESEALGGLGHGIADELRGAAEEEMDEAPGDDESFEGQLRRAASLTPEEERRLGRRGGY